MVKTSLEIECSQCSHRHWYNGDKNNPETVECPSCYAENEIPEEG